jgi:hypothetical protein
MHNYLQRAILQRHCQVVKKSRKQGGGTENERLFEGTAV